MKKAEKEILNRVMNVVARTRDSHEQEVEAFRKEVANNYAETMNELDAEA